MNFRKECARQRKKKDRHEDGPLTVSNLVAAVTFGGVQQVRVRLDREHSVQLALE